MPDAIATLHMFSGKAASGKSTLAKAIGGEAGAVLISEDVWLFALFGDQMETIQDYVRCSARLRDVMGPHVAALLKAGTSVVLDFPANTVETRRWMRGILDGVDAAHQMHVFDLPDAVCLDRLRLRNASGTHPFSLSEEQFHQVSRHYAPPSAEEGFIIVKHSAD